MNHYANWPVRARIVEFFGDEIKQDSGIEGAAAVAHWQTLEAAKPHRSGDTPTCLQGTHTGALTKVGDD